MQILKVKQLLAENYQNITDHSKMSFFIRKGDGSKNYTDRAAKKRKAPDAGKKVKAKRKVENEEIHSDGSDVEGRGDAGYESEEDHETAEEKRLRLAKVYLAEVEKELAERKGGTEDLSKDIEERLREDVDEERGKLRKEFASKLTSLSWADVTYLGNKNHKLSLTCVIISPDSKRVYSGSKDASLLVWDLEKKTQGPNVLFKIPGGRKGEHAKHPGHCNTILALAVSSDNKLLASGDMDKLIYIWDTATMTRIHTFRGHRDAVSGLVFRRGTHTLYSASHDRSVKIWSVDERSYVETLYGHQDKITGIDCGTRERCVTVGGRDASARVWKIVEESQLVFNGPQSSIDCVAMLNEDHWVTGGEDGHLAVWGIHKKKPLTLVCCLTSLIIINYLIFVRCSEVMEQILAMMIQTGSQPSQLSGTKKHSENLTNNNH